MRLLSNLTTSHLKKDSITRTASVSVLFRVFSTSPVRLTLDEFLSGESVGELQMLFIKRTERVTDRWSGQVAFPGGKVEDGESWLDCAVRETREEIGIQLDQDFQLIGEVGDWVAYGGIRVRAFAWFQLFVGDLPLNLQQSEVHSVIWVPISYFSDPLPVTVLYLSGVFENIFPGINLPPSHQHLSLNANKQVDYHLWGMTLSVVQYILQVSGSPIHAKRCKI
eukprot:TRINITY_DN6698_c0_g1_i12.p1 TRINITY_DN6698_c0_g1~~TRINITY_DN6698_c0_g1_i12.p1  ORF type:complete len:223 (+),score=19.68 TRINITY_DN6698_c0_g1_i12:145-813(+)